MQSEIFCRNNWLRVKLKKRGGVLSFGLCNGNVEGDSLLKYNTFLTRSHNPSLIHHLLILNLKARVYEMKYALICLFPVNFLEQRKYQRGRDGGGWGGEENTSFLFPEKYFRINLGELSIWCFKTSTFCQYQTSCFYPSEAQLLDVDTNTQFLPCVLL